MTTGNGKLEIDVPRDRQASFDPRLIAKHQRRFPGFDDKIISMYARGMSTREIVGHLRDPYGIDVSPGVADDPDLEWLAIDATVIRAQAQAAGARKKRGAFKPRRSAVRAAGSEPSSTR